MKSHFQVLLVLAAFSFPVHSKDIYVPEDYPTIQIAIDAAETADTIIVTSGTYFENISFLGKDITVRSGQGPEFTTIDGMQAGSVVCFNSGESEESVLEGFTLTNGSGHLVSSTTYGGGIFCDQRCEPTLRNLIIRENQADNGGGLYSPEGAPRIEHSRIEDNDCEMMGGGIYCGEDSELQLLHCIVKSNRTSHCGGGLYCKDGSPIIVNCKFTENTSTNHGGGIYSVTGGHKLTITNTTVAMNFASHKGSGIYCRSNAQITNSIFWNPGSHDVHHDTTYTFDVTYTLVRGGWPGRGNINTRPEFLYSYNSDFHIVSTSPCRDAGTNDAPYISDVDMDGDPRIIDGTVDMGADEFSAPHGAPGQYVVPGDYASIQQAIDGSFPGDEVVVAPGTYYENLDFKGRPILLRSSNGAENTVIHGMHGSDYQPVVFFNYLEQSDSVLDGFTVRNGSGYRPSTSSINSYGGGICCLDAQPTLLNMVCEDNKAYLGGGIYCDDTTVIDTQKIIGFTIRNNKAERGGGMCIGGKSLIEGCVIENNEGGGLLFKNNMEGTIKDSLIQNNTEGPGIDCDITGSVLIENNTILNNQNEDSEGGGVFATSLEGKTIRHNTIMGNFAKNGGGLFLRRQNLILEDNVIACNHAAGQGGGIKFNQVYDGTIARNTICYNIADKSVSGGGGEGGGAFFYDCRRLEMYDCLIYKNDAVVSGGAMTFSHGEELVFSNLSLINNYAVVGCGIYTKGTPDLHISNSIIRNEGVTEIISLLDKPKIDYTNIRGGWTGTGNIDMDPLFVNEADNDLHLQYASPCRDTGSIAHVQSTTDMEGDPRVAYDTVDMGADEFHPHLYFKGTAKPGHRVDIKLVGLPHTAPVGLFVGSGVLDPPKPTAWGLFYLEAPFYLYLLPAIPASGVLVFSAMIPVSMPAPNTVYLQGLIGGQSDALSNLCIMEIKE